MCYRASTYVRIGISCLAIASITGNLQSAVQSEVWQPSTLTAQFEGESYTVVGVSRQKAQIEFKGSRTTLGKKTRYSFSQAATRLPGTISVTNQQLVSNFSQTVSLEGVVIGNAMGTGYTGTEYFLDLLSDLSQEDCYLAVICYDKTFRRGPDGEPAYYLRFKGLGNLKAGKLKHVTVDLDRLNYYEQATLAVIPMVFSKGREIQTNQSELVAQYFGRMEKIRRSAILAKYFRENSGKSLPASMPEPSKLTLSPNPTINPAEVPSMVDVAVNILANGEIADVQLSARIPPVVATEVKRKLCTRFFLPQLENGKPIPSTITIPLSIELESQQPEHK